MFSNINCIRIIKRVIILIYNRLAPLSRESARGNSCRLQIQCAAKQTGDTYFDSPAAYSMSKGNAVDRASPRRYLKDIE
jgi:hypothetical protein